MNRSPIADLAVVAGALGLAATALVLSFSLPTLAADPAGLALWPRVLCAIILAAGLVVLAARIREGLRRTPPEAASPGAAGLAALRTRPMGRVAVCGGLCIVYAWLVAVLGFTLPSFLFVAALMLFFGGRIGETVAYAAALTAGLHVFFFHVLGATPPSRDWLLAVARSWL